MHMDAANICKCYALPIAASSLPAIPALTGAVPPKLPKYSALYRSSHFTLPTRCLFILVPPPHTHTSADNTPPYCPSNEIS